MVTIADFSDRGQRRSVACVGRDRLGALAGPIEQPDRACRTAHGHVGFPAFEGP